MERPNLTFKIKAEPSDDEFFDAPDSFEDSSDNVFTTLANSNLLHDLSPVSKFYSSEVNFSKLANPDTSFASSPILCTSSSPLQRNRILNTITRPWSTKVLRKNNKDFYEFSTLSLVQELPISQKSSCLLIFSPDGRFLSIAGDDPVITLYEICRQRFSEEQYLLYDANPLAFIAHTGTITDISWSFSSLFFLSSSVDGMVYKWSIAQNTPVATYKHNIEIVCVGTHPKTEDIFFSGTRDNRICIWNSNNSQVEADTAIEGEITAGQFSPAGILVIGVAQGFCFVITYNFFSRCLETTSKISCRNKRGLKSSGRPITGICFVSDELFLVSSNDSRVRLLSMDKFEIKQKYKGLTNERSKIYATAGVPSMHVIAGSENGNVYIWNLYSKYVPKLNPFFTKKKRYKNSSYEFFSVDDTKGLSYAVFAPEKIINDVQRRCSAAQESFIVNNIILVAKRGRLLIFYNKTPINKRFNKLHKSFA